MDNKRDERELLTKRVGVIIALLCVAVVIYIVAMTMSISSRIILTIEILLLAAMAGIVIYALFENAKVMKKLNEDDHARQTILARASRDMRTPMNAIINYSDESMMSHYNPKQIQDSLKEINTSGKYMMTLIDDLLALCNVKEKKFELNEKPHTIVEMIDTTVSMSRERFEEKNIAFHVEYRKVDKFRYVLADEVRVQQILMNLLANASKFTPNDGHVSLIVEGQEKGEDGLDLILHVKDDGVGMSQDKIEKILSDDPKDISIEGPGMGMGIVNQLIHLVNGHITCQSQEGAGTEFIVTLPLQYTSKNDSENVNFDYTVLKGKNILLVENNMLNAEITRNILSNQGMMMDLASDGKQGVAMFTHAMPHTYDAILMDIRMPVMDGLEATKLIRHSTHPEAEIIPIIAMTADAFDEDRKKTKEVGMDAHITKPIDPDELYITLSNYIHS
jgi:signal transduction histidine kinase/CheY-like chemotaxis protein